MDIKVEQIQQIISKQKLSQDDITILRSFGISQGGFVNTNLRLKVWPILLSSESIPPYKTQGTINQNSDQIEKDVNRSLASFDSAQSWSQQKLKQMQETLGNILNCVYYYSPYLNYYQGFNDIASVFLLLGDEELAYKLSYVCAQKILRCFQNLDFSEGLIPLLQQIYHIINLIDNESHDNLQQSIPMFPMFATSWILTWFSHDMTQMSKICRLFDFILSSHSLSPIFISCSIILSQRSSIISTDDPGFIHTLFKDIANDIDIEAILDTTVRLMFEQQPWQLIQEIPTLNQTVHATDQNLTRVIQHYNANKNNGSQKLQRVIQGAALIIGFMIISANVYRIVSNN